MSSIGGVWGSVSSMSVGGDWGSIGTIGGGIWVSSISVVRIGQPWLSFSIGVSRSLANEVSSSIGGDWGSIGSMSVGGDWGSIGTIGGGIWVSSISVSSSIGQPWLGISIGVSGSLSQVTVSRSITVVSKSISTSPGTIGTSIWVSTISVSTIPGIGFGFRFWLSEYAGDENGGNLKLGLHDNLRL